ncbi:hypothetical protein [Nocardia sp. NPDC020380]|uniref:hypothetical protein n=1 Tax=Nocardia sp. NPDC020380 TaxID=3364309 RepID=UPI0037A8D372
MTIEGASEIPPLDDAADFSRSTRVRSRALTTAGWQLPGRRDWVAVTLLCFGVLAVAVVILAIVDGRWALGLVGALVAGVGLAGGGWLIRPGRVG